MGQTAAIASDWVEGGATSFQLPRAPKPVRQNLVVPPENIPSVGIMDQGDQAGPSQAVVPHALEGNVRAFTPANGSPGEPTHGSHIPLVIPPETKLVQPKIFSGWLSETHPDLPPMDRNAVIEVKGQWDDSGHVLHSFGLGFNRISPSGLGKTDLSVTDVLVVDCAGEVPFNSLGIVEKFVREGGYLLTTDWALDGCLAKAIPGFVEWNGGYSTSQLVDATLNKNGDPDLLKNTVPQAYWKLDNKCQTVKVMKPEVEVLAKSRRLAIEDPDGKGYLAVTFPYGQGRVLHLVGHFDNNTDRAFNNALPDPAPNIGISLRQAIAANFIAAALKAHPRPVQPKSK